MLLPEQGRAGSFVHCSVGHWLWPIGRPCSLWASSRRLQRSPTGSPRGSGRGAPAAGEAAHMASFCSAVGSGGSAAGQAPARSDLEPLTCTVGSPPILHTSRWRPQEVRGDLGQGAGLRVGVWGLLSFRGHQPAPRRHIHPGRLGLRLQPVNLCWVWTDPPGLGGFRYRTSFHRYRGQCREADREKVLTPVLGPTCSEFR